MELLAVGTLVAVPNSAFGMCLLLLLGFAGVLLLVAKSHQLRLTGTAFLIATICWLPVRLVLIPNLSFDTMVFFAEFQSSQEWLLVPLDAAVLSAFTGLVWLIVLGLKLRQEHRANTASE